MVPASKISVLTLAMVSGLSEAAISDNSATIQQPGTFLVDIDREIRVPADSRMSKRAVNIPVSNLISYYRARIQIGTPPQNVSVQVDTGSADLWVMSTKNPYCRRNTPMVQMQSSRQCPRDIMFDEDASSTFKSNTSTPFNIKYGDSTFASGNYGTDTIGLAPNTQVMNANFAVASEANSSESVWGIGMESTESIARNVDALGNVYPTYPNLPAQMKDQGIISSVAYSLWLNDLLSSSGSILFGGVDHGKYRGQLQTVPLVSSFAGLSQAIDFSVMLHGISLYGTASGQNVTQPIVQFSLPFLLDSGTTFSMLPYQLLEPVMDSIGALYDPEDGIYIVSCNQVPSDGGLVFDLSGIQVYVAFSELLIPLTTNNPQQSQLCMVGLYPANTDTYILGDTFLRSVYAVYDLESREVALAATNYNSTDSQIENIESGQIPSAIQAPSYSSTTINLAVETITNTQLSVYGTQSSSSALLESQIQSEIQSQSIQSIGTLQPEITSSSIGPTATSLLPSQNRNASAQSTSIRRESNTGNRCITTVFNLWILGLVTHLLI